MDRVPAPPTAPATRLDRAYATVIRVADAVAGRRWLGGALLVANMAAALVVATVVLERFPNSGDEYSYVYQAETLLAGRLWNPSPAAPELFGSYYIVSDGDRTYSSFPLGWPLVLAAFMAAGVPAWAVNALLGALSLLVLFRLGRALHGARVAAIAVLLTGTSAFFVFNAASHFSHTWTSLCVLVAAYAAVRSDDGRAVWPVLAGCAIGGAVLARYFTGVVCALPVVVVLLQRRGRPTQTLALLALGGLPAAMVLAGYSAALTGSPWQLTTLDETYGNWFARRWYLRGFDILANQVLRYVLWTPPLLVFLYLACRRRVAFRRGDALAWMPLLLAVTFIPYVNRGGNQYGPRFYYEAFPFLALAVAACVFTEDRLSGTARARFAALVGSVALTPVAFLALAAVEHRVVVERQDVYRAAHAAGLDDAIVLIQGRVGTTRSVDGRDLTRNGLVVGGPVLFATDLGDAESCRLNAAHYQRQLFRYVWEPARRVGVLTPVTCGRLPPGGR